MLQDILALHLEKELAEGFSLSATVCCLRPGGFIISEVRKAKLWLFGSYSSSLN